MGKGYRKGKRGGKGANKGKFKAAGVTGTERYIMERERKKRDSAYQSQITGSSRPGTFQILPCYARGSYMPLHPKVFIQQRGNIVPAPVSVDVINASYALVHLSSLSPLRLHAFHHVLRAALYDKFNHKKETYVDARIVSSAEVLRMVSDGFEPILRAAASQAYSWDEERKGELINFLLAVVAFCRRMEELSRSFSIGDNVPCPAEFRSDLVKEILVFERDIVEDNE